MFVMALHSGFFSRCFSPSFPAHDLRGGLKASPRWAGAPPGKKISAKFRRKSHPHPLKFAVRTPWNFSFAPLR
ncbi:hypothetical protein Hanom_Chr12g01086141 [Helianthus anomalus]